MLIARLIAEPATLETRLDAMSASLDAQGLRTASAVMLDFCGDVLQLTFADGDPATVLRAIDEHFSPADMLVSDVEIMCPHVFVSDMDSTMIQQECIDELADFAGIKDRVVDITERAMQGELDFESALRERVALLAGLDEDVIETCLADRISATPGARILVSTLKAKGCRTALVTGGFHHFADRIGEELGFDRVVGNTLDVVGGKLTGGLAGSITDANTKKSVLEEEVAKLGPAAISLAMGDGANDIPMIESATYGFAFRAKPKARAAANGRIDRGDLTSALSLLGVPKSEWVE
ncbi:MAG: phosphoserine phosphatase SerB [Pseudomonadota bacterium]